MKRSQNPPKVGDKIRLNVMRYNPADPASVPHQQTYELEQSEGMTLFIALSEIRDKHRSVAAVRLRLPRGDLRQLRDGDQRAARPRLPHADEERWPGHHACTAAGIQADR